MLIPLRSAARRSAFSVGSPMASFFPCIEASLHKQAQVSSSFAKGQVKLSKPRMDAISVTVITFCVNVPVLSEQIKVALPRVSTAGSLRITAFFFAIRCTPRESIIVTIAGRPSGMAATARLTLVINISKIGRPCRVPIKKITTQIDKAAIPNAFPVFSRRF